MKKTMILTLMILALFITACDFDVEVHFFAYEEEQTMKINVTAEDQYMRSMFYTSMKDTAADFDDTEVYRDGNSVIVEGPLDDDVDVTIIKTGNWFKTTYVTTVEEIGEPAFDGALGETIYIYTEGTPKEATNRCVVEDNRVRCQSLPVTITSTCYMFWC